MSELTDQFKAVLRDYSPYVDEMFSRIRFVVLFFLIVYVAGFFFTVPLFGLLRNMFHLKNAIIVATSPFQFLELAMSTGLFFAIIFTQPLIVYHIYAFLKPSLTAAEKKLFFLYSLGVLALFLSGFAYGFIIMYFSVNIMAGINVSVGLQNYWDISKYLYQIFLTSALLGVLFQFPIVLTLLIKAGAFEVRFLQKYRKYAIGIVVIIVTLLPPSDILSLTLMSVPLLAMYEITILVNLRKRKKYFNSLALNN